MRQSELLAWESTPLVNACVLDVSPCFAGTHDWLDAGMAVVTEATLFNQPKDKALEYHVVAVNKAGEGQASGIVDATL